MKDIIFAELIKIKHSAILWVTFLAFSIAPMMGGVFIIILSDPEASANANVLSSKAEMMSFTISWNSYLGLLSQAVGVGGVLLFGFVASWIFGREYSDRTAKDLLSLPTSRTNILNAKFLIYIFWCVGLVISNLIIGFFMVLLLEIPAPSIESLLPQLLNYFLTTALTITLGTPIAFLALWGKGYLSPLGFLSITLVVAQIIAATGYGNYFPWSIPALFSGADGDYQAQLNIGSYIILFLTSILGYLVTTLFWKHADQTE